MEHLKRIVYLGLVAISIYTTSCVKEEYDMSSISSNIVIFKNTTIPIGNIEETKLVEFLKLSEGSAIVETTRGDYVFSYQPEEQFGSSFNISNFSFDGFSDKNDHEAKLKKPIPIPTTIEHSFVSEIISLDNIHYEISIHQDNIPKELKSISHADVNTHISLEFSFRAENLLMKRIHIAEGTTITFPDWIVTGTLDDGLEKDGNTINFTKDFPVDASGAVIDIPITAIDFTQTPEKEHIIEDGNIALDAVIDLNAKVYVKGEDSTGETGIFDPIINAVMDFPSIEVKSATVKITPDFEISAPGINIPSIPDFFKDQSTVLDLDDIRFNLDITNSSPLSGSVSANITTGYANSDFHLADISIKGLRFDSCNDGAISVNKYSISKYGKGASDGYKDIECPEITSLLDKVPEQIRFNNINLDFDDNFVTIKPGIAYNFQMGYSIYAPLAFGKNFSIKYEHPVTGLGINFSQGNVSRVNVGMKISNTIPLDFDIQAVPIDAAGNAIQGIEVSLNSVIKGGSIDSPAVTETIVTLTNRNTSISIDGLKLTLNATASENNVGRPLNKNQGLKIDEIYLSLPNGLGLDLSSAQ